MIEIDLTREGHKQADLLLKFEDHKLSLDYYNGDPRVDVTGTRWTIGNDALLLLAGDVGDQIILAENEETVFNAFAAAMALLLKSKRITFSSDDLLEVWTDLTATDMIQLNEVEEHDLANIPEL